MVKVKICGMRDPSGYEQVLDWTPDALGFVFAPSKRRVTADQPAGWHKLIQHQKNTGYFDSKSNIPPLLTGVFVHPEPQETADTVVQGHLDVVQLHGEETVERISQIRSLCLSATGSEIRIWKALSLPQSGDAPLEHLEAEIRRLAELTDLFLLDTHDPQYVGGSGKTFNWSVIPYIQSVTRSVGRPLWVAGGLHPDNVGALLGEHAIDGVDISSGVETDGIKDLHKIEMFIKRVKSHENMA